MSSRLAIENNCQKIEKIQAIITNAPSIQAKKNIVTRYNCAERTKQQQSRRRRRKNTLYVDSKLKATLFDMHNRDCIALRSYVTLIFRMYSAVA